jgi:hypothetical protein
VRERVKFIVLKISEVHRAAREMDAEMTLVQYEVAGQIMATL